jgi:hypothetical protein
MQEIIDSFAAGFFSTAVLGFLLRTYKDAVLQKDLFYRI